VTVAPSLLEQRLALRAEIQAQRLDVAERLLRSGATGRFPRSMTMRLLVNQPELTGRLVSLVAGARVAGSVSALLVVVQMLRAARSES